MKKFFALITLALMLIPNFAFAADFKSSPTGTVYISESERLRNLYVYGNSVDSNANVSGDLVAAGNNIATRGNIENSLMAAGGNINVNSKIGNSARLAGGNISVNGNISGDLVAAGGNIKVEKEAKIQNDLVAAGGMIQINGMAGRFRASGGSIVLDGRISGDVNIGNVENLTIGDNAVILGKLTYSSPIEAKISDKASISGGIDYKKVERKNKLFKAFTGLAILYNILASFLILLVFIYLFPRASRSFVDNTFESTWRNFGWGFITLIITPIVIFLVMTTVIGLKLGIILGLIYLTVLILAAFLVPLLVGGLLWKTSNREKTEYRVDWLIALIGVLVANLIGLIPIVGPLIIFFLFLLSLGSIWTWTQKLIKAERT